MTRNHTRSVPTIGDSPHDPPRLRGLTIPIVDGQQRRGVHDLVTEHGSVELLRSVPLFTEVPTSALERVLGFSRTVTHAPGDVVVRQGSGAHALHVILSGEAEVSADGVRIATLGRGDYFGEIAVMDSSKRTASVTAVTELRILAIDAISFRRLVRSDPGLASALPADVSKRLAELDQKRGT